MNPVARKLVFWIALVVFVGWIAGSIYITSFTKVEAGAIPAPQPRSGAGAQHDDPLGKVVKRLSLAMLSDGIQPRMEISVHAPLVEVIRVAATGWGLTADYVIRDRRDVQISGYPLHLILLETTQGRKVLLLMPLDQRWTTRIYEAEP